MAKGDQPNLVPIEERVARSVRSGSQSVKAGRFDQIFAEQQNAGELVREAQAAFRAWAHWTAINEAMKSEELARTLEDYTGNGLRAVREALARDAVLIAFRLSDPPQSSRVTLCRAAPLLDDEGVRRRLASREWTLEQGYPDFLVDDGARQNTERIERIRSTVAEYWSKPPKKPSAPEFLDLRQAIRPLRNRLAHAVLGEFPLPIVNQVARFIELTLELATDYALLMVGTSVTANDARDHRQREADKFWSFAFDSMLAKAKLDKHAAE